MSTQNSVQSHILVFRWSYVLAPLLLTVLCLIVALAFLFFLPNPLAFRFNSDGSPLTTMNTYTFVTLMIVVQVLCASVAAVIVQSIVKMSQRVYKGVETPASLDGMVYLLSNMVLLPQAILAYLMLDALIYGVWKIHVISFSLFAILAVLIGTAVLAIQFVRAASGAKHGVAGR
jgi:uncharacterized membrane protein